MHKIKLKVGDIVKVKTSALHCVPINLFYDIDTQVFLCHRDKYAGFEFSEKVGERIIGKQVRVIGVKDFDDEMQFIAVIFWDNEDCISVIGFSCYTGKEFELVKSVENGMKYDRNKTSL